MLALRTQIYEKPLPMNIRQFFNPLTISIILLVLLAAASIVLAPDKSGRSMWNVYTGNDLPLKDTTDMRLPDGSVYEGSISRKSHERQGFGRLTKEDGTVYEGVWHADSLPYGTRHGKMHEYVGTFDRHLNSHGYGIARYTELFIDQKQSEGLPDSDITKEYYGLWRNNLKSGVGRTVKLDGSQEFGNFVGGSLQTPLGADYRVGERVYGIDVSRHQLTIDWDSLALYCDARGQVFSRTPYVKTCMQPVFFAYIKATEGATVRDKFYWRNVTEARRHAIANGAYHFLHLGSSVEHQVMNFLMMVKWRKGDLPPVLDVELEDEILEYGRERFEATVLGWLEEVERRLGVRPVIYTREGIRNLYMKDPRFERYHYWIARYSPSGPKNPFRWSLWQFSDRGRVAGNDRQYDLNICCGDYQWFRRHLLGEK